MIILYYLIILINLSFANLEDPKTELKLKNGLKLYDSESFNNIINIKKDIKLNRFLEMNFYMILNYSKSVYLKAYQYEGDIKFSISLFEIGYINKDFNKMLDSLNYKLTEDENCFITANNINLGMSKEDIVSILGSKYIISRNEMTYIIQDTNYNMPEYSIKILLKNNKVDNIKFGFEYP